MRYVKLQDRVYRGLGMSARHTGTWADAFRPRSEHSPLRSDWRYLRLPVALEPLSRSEGIGTFDHTFWRADLDGSYTAVGDYLVVSDQVFFVASQEPLAPIICVRTNRVLSIARSASVPVTAAGAYGGYAAYEARALLSDYPAAVAIDSKLSQPSAGLPADQAVPYWTILLPAHGDASIAPGDFVSDELGRTAMVTSSDRSPMGWRLVAKTVST